jgi:hypothetical protein
VPAASDQFLRGLPGARGWVFVPDAGFFAKITACVIDTLVSKGLGCHAAAYSAMPGMIITCNRTTTSASKHAAA